MPLVVRIISVVGMVLFSYYMLTKFGVPAVIAGILAMVGGYVVWLFEKNEKDDSSRWTIGLDSLFELKDIVKYVHRIF